jgi:hypothetical protein
MEVILYQTTAYVRISVTNSRVPLLPDTVLDSIYLSSDGTAQGYSVLGDLLITDKYPATLHYLTNSLDYVVLGTAQLLSPTKLRLTYSAAIQNHGATLDVNVTVATGSPLLLQESRKMYTGAVMMAAPTMRRESLNTEVTSDSFEYYPIGHCNLSQLTVIPFIDVDMGCRRAHYYDIGEDKVKVGYSFRAPQALPAAKINLYADGYLGSTYSKQLLKDQYSEFIYAVSSRVHCQDLITTTEKILDENYVEYTQTIQVEIVVSGEPVDLVIRRDITDVTTKTTNVQPATVIQDGQYHWYLTNTGSQIFTIQIVWRDVRLQNTA